MLEKNDILFQTVRPYQQNNYFFTGNNIPTVASTGYAQIKAKINPYYLYQLLHSKSFLNEVLLRCTGSSYPAINGNDLKDITISYSSDLFEQEKISNLFKYIDSIIEKQQQLIDKLKLYKRGVLSSLFEQKVSFVKNSNWTTKSLGDVFTERTERATGNEQLLSVTINDGIQKREELDSKDNSSENKSNYKKVYVDDIAYNTMRMWQGASGYSPFNGIVSPAYTVIKLNDKHNHSIKFWSFYFKHIPLIKIFQKFSQGLTSDTWNLKYPQFAQIQVSYPSYDEQQKIVSILETIDTTILAEEKTLENLVLYKKQLLQKMFI